MRGFLSQREGERAAALSGVGAGEFAVMVELAADAPSPGQLAEALRRGVIPYDSGDPAKPGFTQGIEQGRLANKWIPMIRALAQLWPTPTDALEARLVGQVTTKESEDLYARFGGDPQYWQLLFNTRGEAPTPIELGVLANRGDIPWHGLGADVVSFDQGVHETRWRNKYLEAFRKLAIFRPPESAIVEFLTHGIITNEQASDALARLGMDAATIHLYLQEAHFNATSDYRGATIGQVLSAYHEQLLTADQATQRLAPVTLDLQGLGGMAREVDPGHVIHLGQRVQLLGPSVSAELADHRTDDLRRNDVLRQSALRFSEPCIGGRLHAAIGAEVTTITGRLSVFLPFPRSRQPLELALAGRALAAKEPVRVERDGHPERHPVITHASPQRPFISIATARTS